MLEMLRKGRDQEGFTLIELMVVVLIIAILIAIAIPTFLGARQRAQDRAAQSNLRNAYTAAKTVYTDSQDYTTVTAALVQSAEPTLIIQSAASANPKQISIYTPDSGTFIGAVKSDSGTCFDIMEVTDSSSSSATNPGLGTWYTKGQCTASGTMSGWTNRWS